jgi:preprotein translocase subunit SecF
MITSFKIIEKRNLWFSVSALFIIVGFSLMAYRGLNSNPALNLGIDFAGGSSLILKFEELNTSYKTNSGNSVSNQEINLDFIQKIRHFLKELGLEKSAIQITQDREVLIKTLLMDSHEQQNILNALKDKFGQLEVLEIDFIGPTIGQELRERSLWIILFVTISLLLYITWRFEFSYGLAALLALIHDTLIVISFSAIFNIEITTAFVAALLTVLGYSINDTIVIFDRIRENVNLFRKKHFSMTDIANIALNQTIIRTINTSVTTILVIGSLLFLGGTTIKGFCLVLLVGILAGTYSSLFIASPFLVMLNTKAKADN